MLRSAVIILLVSIYCVSSAQFGRNAVEGEIKAISFINGQLPPPPGFNPQSEEDFRALVFIGGVVQFYQASPDADVQVKVNVSFSGQVRPNSQHGFHIHQFGISELSDDPSIVCGSTGPHWNPLGTNHGFPNARVHHSGDLGNVVILPDNTIIATYSVNIFSLSGPLSVIGRSVVLHAKMDDGGLGGAPDSLKTGNAGGRIACGNIVLSK